MTVVVGIDPDTKATGICIASVGAGGSIRRYKFHVARAKGRLARDRRWEMAFALDQATDLWPSTVDDLAIEFQATRPGDPRPNDIMAVQAVAGIALGVAGWIVSRAWTPLPHEWKGSVPKEIHQRRILKEAGLTLDSPELAGIPRGQRTHCVDALGLCLWVLRGRKL